MINLSFDGTDKKASRVLIGRLPAVIESVRRRFARLSLMLQQKIQADKLQGQVLQHRSGKLAGSIRAQPAESSGDKVTTSVEGGGGVAPYGAVQNYGGKGPYEIVPVNKKALAFFPAGGVVPLDKAVIRRTVRGFNSKRASVRLGAYKKFGDLGGVIVKKVIHPPLPARNFMESTADEMKPVWVEETTEAVVDALRGKVK